MSNEFEREPVVEPLAGATAKGYPYPLPTEPVSQGAAAIQALAAMIDLHSALSVAVKAVFTSSVLNYVIFDSAPADDQGNFVPSLQWFTAKEPGDYLAMATAQWTGGTGTGGAKLTVEHYNSTAGAKLAILGNMSTLEVNGLLNAAGIARMAINERIYVGASNTATGTAGNLAVRFAVLRL